MLSATRASVPCSSRGGSLWLNSTCGACWYCLRPSLNSCSVMVHHTIQALFTNASATFHGTVQPAHHSQGPPFQGLGLALGVMGSVRARVMDMRGPGRTLWMGFRPKWGRVSSRGPNRTASFHLTLLQAIFDHWHLLLCPGQMQSSVRILSLYLYRTFLNLKMQIFYKENNNVL